jgi:hypothetical protein
VSPADLDKYLQVLKTHGVASAQVTVSGGTIAVVFGPEALPAGDEPTKGGWKGPERLDVLNSDSEVP